MLYIIFFVIYSSLGSSITRKILEADVTIQADVWTLASFKKDEMQCRKFSNSTKVTQTMFTQRLLGAVHHKGGSMAPSNDRRQVVLGSIREAGGKVGHPVFVA